MTFNPTKITFFERFEADILSGAKTITIRDASEKAYTIGSIVDVATHETDRWFAKIKILAITPIHLDQLNEQHAQQENMSLTTLREVITEIYPNQTDFYVIHFELLT